MHIMIDTETLALSADAALMQIGACAFEPDGNGLSDDGICLNIDPQASINAGMKVEWSTIHWWMTQPEAARTLSAPGDGLLLSAALHKLADYVGKWPGACVWSNGAAFDIPVLETSYRRCGIAIPWHYGRVRDTRTLDWLVDDRSLRVEPELSHNALSDARAQALWVQNMVKRMAGVPVDGPSELSQFWHQLSQHDWFFCMSDDHSVYQRGAVAEAKLQARGRELGPEGEAMFNNWRNFKNGKEDLLPQPK